jgi:hypothetical protein
MLLESKFTVNRDDLHNAIMFFKRMLKCEFKWRTCKIRIMPGGIEISTNEIFRAVNCISTEGIYEIIIPMQLIYAYTYTIPSKILHISIRDGEFQCGNSIMPDVSIRIKNWNPTDPLDINLEYTNAEFLKLAMQKGNNYVMSEHIEKDYKANLNRIEKDVNSAMISLKEYGIKHQDIRDLIFKKVREAKH